MAGDVGRFEIFGLDDLGSPNQWISFLWLHLDMIRRMALLHLWRPKDTVPSDLVVHSALFLNPLKQRSQSLKGTINSSVL